MRAILEVLRSIGLWLATGGVGVRPLILTPPRPDIPLSERRRERPGASQERRAAGL